MSQQKIFNTAIVWGKDLEEALFGQLINLHDIQPRIQVLSNGEKKWQPLSLRNAVAHLPYG